MGGFICDLARSPDDRMQCVETIRNGHGGKGCNVREADRSKKYVQPHVVASALILYQLRVESRAREALKSPDYDGV